MKSIEEIREDIKKELTPKRFKHSIGTMEKAIELAKKYGEDIEKVQYTALVHDMAKEMSKEQLIEYCKRNNIKLSKMDKLVPDILHGIVAADIATKEYGFTKEMHDAIYYHTTGREEMTLLDKIIYIADKSEEKTRIGEYAEELRKITKDKGLNEAILFIIDNWTIPKSIKEKKIIHINTIYARNDILKSIKE
ncbi:MAG: HD domain-containing protein [Clostridiaceae bacterium]|nr:HD domain-containing protein [Clostridiaceae bacterium]